MSQDQPEVQPQSPADTGKRTSSPSSSADTPPEMDTSKRKKRKPKEHSNLSNAQEEDMFEWLQENPVLYSRGMTGYKDVQARNKLWADKAAEMGKAVNLVKDIWYKSVRSRMGRLLKQRSGDPQFDVEACSDRDKYLMEKMAFMIPHIHEVRKRPLVSVSLYS